MTCLTKSAGAVFGLVLSRRGAEPDEDKAESFGNGDRSLDSRQPVFISKSDSPGSESGKADRSFSLSPKEVCHD